MHFAPVIIVVCYWNHYLDVSGWSYTIRYNILANYTVGLWIICNDFLTLWLASWCSIYWTMNWRLWWHHLHDGASFSKLTSLMEHFPSNFMLNISVSLLQVMFKHKGWILKQNNTWVTSSILLGLSTNVTSALTYHKQTLCDWQWSLLPQRNKNGQRFPVP